jgi:hypothetical protein
MDVLIPKGFDIKSIDKCMIDELCNFILLDDNSIKERLGTIFVILKEEYFIIYTAKHNNIICDYNCRNFIMSYLYPRRGNDLYYENLVNNNFGLKLIDGIINNIQLPYLIFTNKGLHDNATEENTIIENYNEIDMKKFAKITKNKKCNKTFFIIYLDNEKYICCNIETLETYQYSRRLKYHVIKVLYENVNNIKKLKEEDEILKNRKSLQRINNFKLIDIKGQPLEEKKDYYLKMFNQDEDILDIYDNKICNLL